MAVVPGDADLELAATEDLWPLEGVTLGSEFGGTSDARGFFRALWREATLGVAPLSAKLRFAKSGYRSEERKFWLTNFERGRLLVILFISE